MSKLQSGTIRIYTRDYQINAGKIEIDIRDVSDEELSIISQEILKIIKERSEE